MTELSPPTVAEPELDRADWRRFRLLVAGNGASSFGSYLNMVALQLFVYQTTGSAVATGLFMVLRMATGFVAGLAGGTVAARLPRRPVMITCDLVQASVLAVFALSPNGLRLALLPVLAVSIGALTTTSQLLLRATVPDFVGPEHRMRANGLLVTGRAVAMALGFATGGLLVSWVGYTVGVRSRCRHLLHLRAGAGHRQAALPAPRAGPAAGEAGARGTEQAGAGSP